MRNESIGVGCNPPLLWQGSYPSHGGGMFMSSLTAVEKNNADKSQRCEWPSLRKPHARPHDPVMLSALSGD